MSDKSAIEWTPRLCLLCPSLPADFCDEMICGYLCSGHLDDWGIDEGYVADMWSWFCSVAFGSRV